MPSGGHPALYAYSDDVNEAFRLYLLHRNAQDMGQFAKTATKLKEILERFLETLCCLDCCFVSADWLEELASPSKAVQRKSAALISIALGCVG